MLGTATVLAVSDIPAAPVLGLMALGVVTALVGHIMRDRVVVGVGVAVIFLATLAMVIFAFASYQDGSSDPRPAPKDCPLCSGRVGPGGAPAPPPLTRRT